MTILPVTGKEINTIKLLNNSCIYDTRELVSCGQLYLFPTANVFVQYCFHEAGLERPFEGGAVQPLAQRGAGKTRLERVSTGENVGGDTGCALPRPLGNAAKMGGLRKAGQGIGLPGRGGFPGGRSAAGRPGQRPAAGTDHHAVSSSRTPETGLHRGFHPIYRGSVTVSLKGTARALAGPGCVSI